MPSTRFGVEVLERSTFLSSDHVNGSGNAYRDVVGLEPSAAHATEPDLATLTSILDELRTIRVLLTLHVDGQTPEA